MQIQINQFVSIGENQINSRMLTRELSEFGLETQGISFPDSDSVLFIFSSELTSDDQKTLLEVCESHKGGNFSAHNLAKFELGEIKTQGAKTKSLTLETGPLEQGDYLLIWYSEFSLEGVLIEPGATARAELLVSRDGGSEQSKAMNENDRACVDSFGGITFMSFRDGQSASISIQLSAHDDPDGLMTAMIKNCQIFVRKS